MAFKQVNLKAIHQDSKEILKISPETKILFATGYDRDATLQGDDLGEVLLKPFTIPNLSKAIKEALRH